jgi:hypothetical protein
VTPLSGPALKTKLMKITLTSTTHIPEDYVHKEALQIADDYLNGLHIERLRKAMHDCICIKFCRTMSDTVA